MTNKIKIFIFAFLTSLTLSNVFAARDNPEVFWIARNEIIMGCAEIDNDLAFCWEPLKNEFVELSIRSSEKNKVSKDQHGRFIHYHEDYYFCNPGELRSITSILKELGAQVLKLEKYRSEEELAAPQINKMLRLFGTPREDLIKYEEYQSKHTRTNVAKIRALGVAVYKKYGNEKMVDICDSLPSSKGYMLGVSRVVEYFWDGIGDWLG